jgi:hypothetical protein
MPLHLRSSWTDYSAIFVNSSSQSADVKEITVQQILNFSQKNVYQDFHHVIHNFSRLQTFVHATPF